MKKQLSEYVDKNPKLFYSFLFVVAIVFAGTGKLSKYLIGEYDFQIVLESILLNMSSALFVLALVYWFSNMFLVDRNEQRFSDIEAKISEVNSSVSILSNTLAENEDKVEIFVDRDEYYPKYYKLLNEAEKSVHSIGDGFSFHSKGNAKRAMGLINSFRTALDNKCKVDRFQFHNTLTLKWLDEIIKLKEDFDTLFRVYFSKSMEPQGVPYVICVTDVHSPNASVNIMFTSTSDTSLQHKQGWLGFVFEKNEKTANSIHIAFNDFFNGNHEYSIVKLKQLRKELEDERKLLITNEVKKDEYTNTESFSFDDTSVQKFAENIGVMDVELVRKTILEYVAGKEKNDWLAENGRLYFAYGSNLSIDRIQARTPSARFITKATLRHYKIVFDILGNAGEGKNGGIANLREAAKDYVIGYIYWLSSSDFNKLKKIEEDMRYETVSLEVELDSKADLELKNDVYVFIKKNTGTTHHYPNKEYLDLIIKGLKERNTDEKYIEKIKQCAKDIQIS